MTPSHNIKLFLENIGLALISFLMPLRAVATSILVLCIVDLVLGVKAAKKRRKKIESRKLKRTISKLALYYTSVLVTYIASTYLVDPMIPVERIVTTLIGVVEVKSIFENLDIISGGSFLKAALKQLERSDDEAK